MFPTFTGSSRSKRQVNLSGRHNNPFAAYRSFEPSAASQTSHHAVAHAQQERIIREQERRRPTAATKIQRTWRRYRCRKDLRRRWREQWDHEEGWDTPQLKEGSYDSQTACVEQLRLLALFSSTGKRSNQDVQRLLHSARRYKATDPAASLVVAGRQEFLPSTLTRLLLKILGLPRCSDLSAPDINVLLFLLTTLVADARSRLANAFGEYYETIDNVARYNASTLAMQAAVIVSLAEPNAYIKDAYIGFSLHYLSKPYLPGFGDDLEKLYQYINIDILASALDDTLSISSDEMLLNLNFNDGLLWILSRFIHFQRRHWKDDGRIVELGPNYVQIVSRLISVLAADIEKRIDVVETQLHSRETFHEHEKQESAVKVLPAFVRSQILSLVSQENVSGLLANLEANDPPLRPKFDNGGVQASAFASYALTLLRVFPKRRENIQLWLYRGLAECRNGGHGPMPTTKYLFQAASSTKIFSMIAGDPRQVVVCLRPWEGGDDSRLPLSRSTLDSQWRIIILFLELYAFMLHVMDDEEFLSGSFEPPSTASWTRQSALPMVQIKELTVILRNLAFALYWYTADLAGEQVIERNRSLAAYFGKGVDSHEVASNGLSTRADEKQVGGISGMNIKALKGLVVGALRMIYQRDSRRKILPKDHWLMTQYFEMDHFISAVVSEEEHLRELGHEDQLDASKDATPGVESDSSDESSGDWAAHEVSLVGTRRVQNLRRTQRLQDQQRKVANRKKLESVTPRLKILENLPFFIPFHTRVAIFRQFVTLDQIRRRGTDDPDMWRQMAMHQNDNMSKHRATVRREHVFDDALDQFYDLGEGIKEPIQIRFVDKFDTIEEGIDGGGVTKEFLTSVTNEAFGAADGGESLFVENDHHLLYPNPASVEERKEVLRQAMFTEGSLDWNDSIRHLLKRYEFLGRVIGKCLYEGILVDVNFAPFFLLKWSLTGEPGSTSRESGYRANLDDLRDLDESLYQGLLQLKNYPGDVESDFSLDFAVTDTLRVSPTQTKKVTRDLKLNGEQIPVNNENRLVYIASIARHRLQTQPYRQTSAFLRGLGSIISPSWLSMFNQSELQTLLGGSGSGISIADLRANTQYGGVYIIGDDGLEHPSIQHFWKVMESLPSEDVAKVLKFVTSTPRAPLLGFASLNPRFSIRDSGADQTRLPSTSTCVNLLKLPIYRDTKVLKERLLYSVNSGAGFNLS